MSGSTKNGEAAFKQKVASFFFSFWLPAISALCGYLVVALTIDVADELAWSRSGPGLTFDEGFNIEVGIYLTESFRALGLAALHPASLLDLFDDPHYNPDHPPLGRIAMGATHTLAQFVAPRPSKCGYVVSDARLASAIEYGLLVGLLTFYTQRWYGWRNACAVGIALLCQPRLFAHAHFAALETCTCLMLTWPLLVLADRWSGRNHITWWMTIWPGCLLGLAFLTKIHAVILPPVILVWGLWHWRLQAIVPLLLLCSIAFAVFFLGWPWLWIDPAAHLAEYFGRATDRVSLNCFYMGQKFADSDVPSHYPFVMFIVTTPAAFLIAGLVGLIRRPPAENSVPAIFDRRTQLFFGAWLLSLLLFALPGVTVYDGIRLFLMAVPFYSIFVGLGAVRLLDGVHQRWGWCLSVSVVVLALAHPVYSMVRLHPCQLSYYNELTGGLHYADRLGFEATYWGDSVTPEFLAEVSTHLPEGATLEVAPVLHTLQLEFLRCGSWLKHRPDVNLSAYDDHRTDLSPYVLVIRRKADPWDSLTPPPEGTQQLAVVERQGVVLAELLKLPTEQ